MKLGFTPAEERFRSEAAAWLEGQLRGPFKDLRGVSSMSGQIRAAHGTGSVRWAPRASAASAGRSSSAAATPRSPSR